METMATEEVLHGDEEEERVEEGMNAVMMMRTMKKEDEQQVTSSLGVEVASSSMRLVVESC